MQVARLYGQTSLAYSSIWSTPSELALSRSRRLLMNRHHGSHVPAQTGILLIQLDSDHIRYVA